MLTVTPRGQVPSLALIALNPLSAPKDVRAVLGSAKLAFNHGPSIADLVKSALKVVEAVLGHLSTFSTDEFGLRKMSLGNRC